MPGAFEAMVAKRRRDRAAEARARGDAAFASAVMERTRWRAAIASCGGIIADETIIDGRSVRDARFDVVPRRYRSTQRAAWTVGGSNHPGNVSQIIDALTSIGIETGWEGVLAWCSADKNPSRTVYRLIAKSGLDAECDAEVRELFRSRFIRIVGTAKTQRKVDERKRKRKAAIKRDNRAKVRSRQHYSVLLD